MSEDRPESTDDHPPTSTEQPESTADKPTVDRPLPEFIDWLLGAVIALVGAMSMVGGSSVAILVDEAVVAETIETESVTVTIGTTELTDAEAIDLANTVLSWVGIGLLVSGIAMILFGVGYVIARHRAHNRARRGESISSYSTYAVLGAFVTALFSFVPFSSALGGAGAGYLERRESTRFISVGAVAGILPLLPFLVILVFVGVGLVDGVTGIDRGGWAIVVGTMVFVSVLLVGVVGAGLGALGGYVGGKIAEGRMDTNE